MPRVADEEGVHSDDAGTYFLDALNVLDSSDEDADYTMAARFVVDQSGVHAAVLQGGGTRQVRQKRDGQQLTGDRTRGRIGPSHSQPHDVQPTEDRAAVLLQAALQDPTVSPLLPCSDV